jgi:hypothetical protein
VPPENPARVVASRTLVSAGNGTPSGRMSSSRSVTRSPAAAAPYAAQPAGAGCRCGRGRRIRRRQQARCEDGRCDADDRKHGGAARLGAGAGT